MLAATTLTLPLPTFTSLTSLGLWSQSVKPYLPQLAEFPYKLLNAFVSSAKGTSIISSLIDAYVSTNPAIVGLAISLGLAPIFLVVSEATGNYSQVDRCWSILPTFYMAHYTLWAYLAGLPTKRLLNVLAVGCLWSARLTYNYWRKGGYEWKSEDYRWEILKGYVPKPVFFVFNVTFIATMQSILLWGVSTPVYILLVATPHLAESWDLTDMVFLRIMAILNAIIYISDQQQWNYQTAKKIYKKHQKTAPGYAEADLKRGFVTRGLWSVSRHPNFAAEQSIWVTLYCWAAWQIKAPYNWTFWGMLSYLALFQGSTLFTEYVSSGKYPDYKQYQKVVPMFIPKPWTVFNTVFPLEKTAVVGSDESKNEPGDATKTGQ